MRRLPHPRRQTGSFAALPQGGVRRVKLDEFQRQRLRRLVQEHPDASLAELRDILGAPP
jgi:hypothetical protein